MERKKRSEPRVDPLAGDVEAQERRAYEHRCSLPRNFDDFDHDFKLKVEEDCYRKMLIWKWGFKPGDERLRSMGGEAQKDHVVFGEKVDVKVVEEDL